MASTLAVAPGKEAQLMVTVQQQAQPLSLLFSKACNSHDERAMERYNSYVEKMLGGGPYYQLEKYGLVPHGGN